MEIAFHLLSPLSNAADMITTNLKLPFETTRNKKKKKNRKRRGDPTTKPNVHNSIHGGCLISNRVRILCSKETD